MGAVVFEDTLLDATGAGITGSTGLTITIRRVADDFLFDFNDTTFKNSGWTTKAQAMIEVDAVELLGSYDLSVTVTAWDDGEYVAYFIYDGSDVGLMQYRVSLSFWVRGGVEAGAVSMRGTDGANLLAPNTVVPDAVGTAAALHAITDGKVDAVQVDTTIIAGDVVNIDGAAMRGTNDALLAASALSVDTIIDGTITLKKVMTLLLAQIPGKQSERDGDVYTFRNQAGDVIMTVTYTASSTVAVIA